MSRRLAICFVFALLLAAPAFADDWNRNYSVAGRPEVRVDADDGHVNVSTGARGEVSIRIETVGWRIADNEVRVSAQQSADRISLDVRVPRLHWSFGGMHSIRIFLRVPRESDLHLKKSVDLREWAKDLGDLPDDGIAFFK